MESESIYFSDVEHAGEMARLVKQARLTTKGWGGPFPKPLDLSGVHDVLDLACGPGEWVLNVAHTYPAMQVTGVDISENMIKFAKNIGASVAHTHFQIMNILHPLNFPDDSFDLVNARFLFGFMKPAAWSMLLKECRRILRPGGVQVLTEAECSLSNSFASEQLNALFTQALLRVGQSFSPDGRHIGILPMLGQLLENAGFKHIQQQFQGADLSAGTERHQSFLEDYQALFHLMQPFLLQTGVTTRNELEPLYHQMMLDLRSPTFRAVGFSVQTWGYTPAAQDQ